MDFLLVFLLSLSLLSSVTCSVRRSIKPVIAISDGEIKLPPTTTGFESACSTITTTIGNRVDTLPVPCYNALSTPTLTEDVMIGTSNAVLIIGPSGDVVIESKPWLLHATDRGAGDVHTTPRAAPFRSISKDPETSYPHQGNTTQHGKIPSSASQPTPTSGFDPCPAISVASIPGCWGQAACALYL